jgi:hypothetical protein
MKRRHRILPRAAHWDEVGTGVGRQRWEIGSDQSEMRVVRSLQDRAAVAVLSVTNQSVTLKACVCPGGPD